MRKKDMIFGIIGGIVLYLPLIFSNYLVYFPVLDERFELWFMVSVLIGGAIAVASITLKNNSAKYAFIRTIILLVSYYCTIVFNGCIGTLLFIDSIFGIQDSEATGRVAGLSMVFFEIGVFGICIVTNVVMAIISLVRRCVAQGT